MFGCVSGIHKPPQASMRTPTPFGKSTIMLSLWYTQSVRDFFFTLSLICAQCIRHQRWCDEMMSHMRQQFISAWRRHAQVSVSTR